MKDLLKLTMLLALALVFSACNKDEDNNNNEPAPDPNAFRVEATTRTNPDTQQQETVYNVYGTLRGNYTFEASKKYKLNGYVRVENGGALTIEAGTIIYGDFQTRGTLIIQRGGKIYANGTAEAPIVFTSYAAKGQRAPGQWGGVVICGKAPNNQGTDVVLEGDYGGIHGGNDPDDNSGVFKYVRIEFGGVALLPNQEINGLTMGSVGRGTELHHVQVSYNGDDAFEWFGGTVNCTHLIALGNIDDDFDVDFGYSGFVQYGIGLRAASNADQSGSNGFEVDNDASGSGATPFTSASFANITVVGPQATSTTTFDPLFGRAAHLRRNSRLQLYNSILAGYPRGLDIDGNASQDAATAGDLKVRGCVVACLDGSKALQNSVPTNGTATLNTATWFATAIFNNASTSTNTDVFSTFPVAASGTSGSQTAPNGLRPSATNLPATTATTLPSGFGTATTFAGALDPNGTADWTANWSNWNPNQATY
jgi:hypothetical protein